MEQSQKRQKYTSRKSSVYNDLMDSVIMEDDIYRDGKQIDLPGAVRDAIAEGRYGGYSDD